MFRGIENGTTQNTIHIIYQTIIKQITRFWSEEYEERDIFFKPTIMPLIDVVEQNSP